MTKGQIDRLGERLRCENYSDEDLRLLDEYRRSFDESYEAITREIRQTLHLEPTGRPAKSTPSIIGKLQRLKSSQLSRIQDIAGCRIVVEGISEQNQTIERLKSIFSNLSVKDRRKIPSHGYRAVHLILKVDGKLFEIQIRTILQHLWAEFSERLSDAIDARIKYGKGPEASLNSLKKASLSVQAIEEFEEDYCQSKRRSGILPHELPLPRKMKELKNQLKELLAVMVNKA